MAAIVVTINVVAVTQSLDPSQCKEMMIAMAIRVDTIMDLEADLMETVIPTTWDHPEAGITAGTTADSLAVIQIGSVSRDSASLRTDQAKMPMTVVSEEWAELEVWEVVDMAVAVIWAVVIWAASMAAVSKHLSRCDGSVFTHCCRSLL